MKNYNFLFIILLGITLANCGGAKKGENTLFTFDNSNFKEHYVSQDTIELGSAEWFPTRSEWTNMSKQEKKNWEKQYDFLNQ